MFVILRRTAAEAELKSPAAVQGAFIHPGNVFDAMIALGKVLKTGTSDVLIVDPYMDEKALSDYALQIPQNVPIRLLSDQHSVKPTLRGMSTMGSAALYDTAPGCTACIGAFVTCSRRHG